MSLFSDTIRGVGTSFSDRIRGLNPVKQTIVNPIEKEQEEIQTMMAPDKSKSLKDIRSVFATHPQKDQLVDFARKAYFGATDFAKDSTKKAVRLISNVQEAPYKAPGIGPVLTQGHKNYEKSIEKTGVDITGVLGATGDISRIPKVVKGLAKTVQEVPEAFAGFKDLTTKVLDRLKGKSVTSKQEILDLTNMGEMKQAERDLIRNVVGDYPDKVPVQEFANKVKTELLPLKTFGGAKQARYENIALPDELRGPVANYQERIYESPIKTSAGSTHFDNASKSYFAHTRVEDLPPSPEDFRANAYFADQEGINPADLGRTRRVIELQSDLFQKNRLGGEAEKVLGEVHSTLGKEAIDGLRKAFPKVKEGEIMEYITNCL